MDRSEQSRSIRPYREADESQVVEAWHRAGKAAYPYLPLWQSLDLAKAREIFRVAILGKTEIWVALSDDRIAAFLALEGSTIDRLYVDPRHWRKGWGTCLLEHAKRLRPEGLELFTHQENRMARTFYEKHGFQAVAFGISPPPESMPDVKYRWSADGI